MSYHMNSLLDQKSIHIFNSPEIRMNTDGVIIILGSPNKCNGDLYDVAKARCKLALSIYRKHINYKFLLTGGFGAHFNTSSKPHACYLKKYLVKAGVSEENILEYAESANSIEDALLSKEIIIKHNIHNVIVVTSDYHQKRAKFIFKNVFSNLNINLSFSLAKTNIKNSQLDIKSLIKHEKKALKNLNKIGIESQLPSP
jgi:uncharacterized SAM-binding protein YcdF (DUF218 family)